MPIPSVPSVPSIPSVPVPSDKPGTVVRDDSQQETTRNWGTSQEHPSSDYKPDPYDNKQKGYDKPEKGYEGILPLWPPPSMYKPPTGMGGNRDDAAADSYGPRGYPWPYPGNSHPQKPNADTAFILSIVLPLLFLFILFFLIYRTWPKTLVLGKNLLSCLGLAEPDPLHQADALLDLGRTGEFRKALSNSAQPRSNLDQITLGSANVELSDKVLGRGEYGLVTKGYASGLLGYPPRTVVAAKTLIRPEDPKHRACFLKEIEMMMYIGRHLNIVNLLGTVMEGNPMLVLEYCANGSLKRFLKKQRTEYFYNHVDPDGSLLAFDDEEIHKKQALLAQKISSIYGLDDTSTSRSHLVLSTRDLINLSYQIVRGLEYLSSHSIVHRDIAARNVLVTDRNIAKLSDFGMAVQWTNDVSVKQKDFDYPMPVKWMAPESILRKTFSQKSDVWAFGILLHEVFTLGGDPYPDFTIQGQVMEFISKIMDGLRMNRPSYFPADLYTKMAVKCLEIDATNRPTFVEIRQILEEYIPLTRQEEYLELSQEYEDFNEMFGTMSNNAYVDLNYESINYKKY